MSGSLENVETYVFPLSFAQQQLWYINQFDPGSTAYNIPFAFRLRGRVDAAALEHAFRTVIGQEEALRTRFAMVDGEPSQIVSEEVQFALVRLALDSDDLDSAISSAIEAEISTPFDIEKDLLFRAGLAAISETDSLLLMSFHHIILDHWSVLQVAERVQEAYRALRRGDKAPERTDHLQYPDFAVWQREALDDATLDEKMAFWEASLDGKPQTLDLPVDRARPRVQTFNGAEQRFGFSPELSKKIRDFSQTQGLSLFVTCLSALSVLLERFSNQQSMIIGCPFANRTNEELEDVVGLFMNVLPIGVGIEPEQTFEALTSVVRRLIVAAQGHQDTPFEMIVHRLASDRDTAYNPLVQVWYTFQDAPMSLSLEGLEVESIDVHNKGAKLDLNFWLWEDGDTIGGLLEFNTDLFTPGTVEHMLDNFEVIFDQLVSASNTPLKQLELLSTGEQTRILSEWCGPQRTLTAGCLADLFNSTRAQVPDRMAVVFDDKQLSYREVDEMSNRLGRVLLDRLDTSGTLVGLAISRSEMLLISTLAIWKAGCAYVPLDPAFPEHRLRFMLEDSGAEVLITESALTKHFPDFARPTILLDADAEQIQTSDAGALEYVQPHELAYLIYTSGSTGKPKGVRVGQSQVMNFLASMAENPGIEQDDCLLAVTTLSFDISVLELFLPMTRGGCVQIAPPDSARDGILLSRLIEESKTTVMQATPSTWRLLLNAGWTGKSGLRVLCGGEPLPAKLAGDLLGKVGSVWNMYGPTETTVWSACEQLRLPVDRILIGRPIANTQIYILDSWGRLLPAGVAGEIVIGGFGVAAGYHERPDLNEDRFVPDPFGNEPDALMYRTGDRGRYKADGRLEHLGRLDHQVKIRGFRIELGEIETTIMELSPLAECVAYVHQLDEDDQRLVAYLVPRTEEDVDLVGLRKALRTRLPDYMIPQELMILDSLPRTPNQKIDRGALKLKGSSRGAARAGSEPETETEKRLAEIWLKYLRKETVDRNANFFELGGHSLLAVRVMNEVQETLGVKLTLISMISESLAQTAQAIGEVSPPDSPQAVPQSHESQKPGLISRLTGLFDR